MVLLKILTSDKHKILRYIMVYISWCFGCVYNLYCTCNRVNKLLKTFYANDKIKKKQDVNQWSNYIIKTVDFSM